MTAPQSAESFEEARRRHLIQATIETLGDVGFRAASLSEIARRAKVSTGLFAHYFGDKDGLLEATLRFMAASLTRATAEGLRKAATRRDRLFAVSDAALSDDQFESRTSAVWLAFWGQLTHSERYKRVQRIYQRRMTANLRHGLKGMVAPDCVPAYATMIAAMIDGLWLRSHIGDGAIGSDGASARALVRSFIDGLLAAPTAGIEAEPVRPLPLLLPEPPPEPLLFVSPVTGIGNTRLAPARDTEIRRGVQDARRGASEWAGMHPAERSEVFQRCAEALRRDGASLAHGESLETGRPLRITGGPDLACAIASLERAAGLAAGLAPSRIELAGGRECRTRHRPAGLVAAHIPWSRCLVELCQSAAWLAQGNAVIACADGQAGETADRLLGLFRKAGLPEGALVLLRGDALSLRLLERQPEVLRTEALRFVDGASDPDGTFWATRPKGTALILSGADPERAAARLLDATAAWRATDFLSETMVYVHETARAGLVDCLAEGADRLRAGDPRDPATDLGPLLSERHRAWVLELIAADCRSGARLVTGGRALPRRDGAPVCLAPTVLDGCNEDSTLVRTSSFAPVVTLIPFTDTDALVGRLRRGPSDGAVALFAGEADRAQAVAERLDRALVVVNDEGWGTLPCAAAEAVVHAHPRRIVAPRG